MNVLHNVDTLDLNRFWDAWHLYKITPTTMKSINLDQIVHVVKKRLQEGIGVKIKNETWYREARYRYDDVGERIVYVHTMSNGDEIISYKNLLENK